MTTISVWHFPDPHGAADGLRILERQQTRHRLTIDDCAVLEWPAGERRPVAFQAGPVDGAAALSGAFWGLLFGSQFLAPLAGLDGPAWPPDGLGALGLPETLLRELRRRTRPGTSVLFVLSPDDAVDRVRESLADTVAGRGLTSALTAEQDRALQCGFGTGTPTAQADRPG